MLLYRVLFLILQSGLCFQGCSADPFAFTEYICRFRGERFIESLQKCWYNKALVIKFNRTTRTYTGLTKWTSAQVEAANGTDMLHAVPVLDGFCKNAQILRNHLKSLITQPYVRLQPVIASKGVHTTMLQCSVYGFYPKQIRMTWKSNGQELMTGVTPTKIFSNGHWSYQAHSSLVLLPGSWEEISCVVEHASFKEPLEQVWVWSMSVSDRNKVIAGSTILILGVVIVIAGGIFWFIKVKRWSRTSRSSNESTASDNSTCDFPLK